MLKKLIIFVLLLLVLAGCEKSVADDCSDYVEAIAFDNHFNDDYIYTIEPAYNCKYDDAYIITFYNHAIISDLSTTYLAYRVGNKIHWEVLNYA